MLKRHQPLPERRLADERFAWRETVTLCVAAQCTDGKKQKVVFASDFRVENEISSAEIESKLSYVGIERFPVLMAGSLTRARELCSTLGRALEQRHTEDVGELASEFCKQAVMQHKRNLINEYIGALFGMDYETFTSYRSRFPEEQYREVMYDIARMSIGCDLLVMAFVQDQSQIIRMNGTGSNTGTAEFCTNFAAIGSGFYIAESALFQREHSIEESLADTIYHVYEAMRLGAKAPGVGEFFTISVASANKDEMVKWEFLEDEYIDFLETQYEVFGPRQLNSQELKPQWIKKQDFKQ